MNVLGKDNMTQRKNKTIESVEKLFNADNKAGKCNNRYSVA